VFFINIYRKDIECTDELYQDIFPNTNNVNQKHIRNRKGELEQGIKLQYPI